LTNPILYLNGYAIPYGDVKTWPSVSEEINYDSTINVPDTRDIVLDNTNPATYDPRYSGALFYGTQIFKLPVSIYEPDLNCYTSRGLIQNVSTNSSGKDLTITYQSTLSAISNNDCQYVNTNITPAQALYNMLTAPLTLGTTTPLVDPSLIDRASFNYAATVQAAGVSASSLSLSSCSSSSCFAGDLGL